MRGRQIPRDALVREVRTALRRSPIVSIIGPRQCGKSTLARQVATGRAHSFDLENPVDIARLDQPYTALAPLRGLVVIDEVQFRPELFPLLRVLADRQPLPARFLLLGSASPDLIRNASESLAGRVAFVPMGGFDVTEAARGGERAAIGRLWLRGGLPPAFLAASDEASRRWREDFVQTFLERDIRKFGVEVPPQALRRLWTMLAHYHGQVWNASELGRSLGESHTTIKRHLDILTGALMVRQLPPWFENLGKRQVKSPKVYLRDSGVLHALLGLSSFASLEAHPKIGASWEGFVIEQVLRRTGDRDAYSWATPSGAELDLLVFIEGRRIGFEVKYADAPRWTKSMAIARQDLRLDRLLVVYPGDRSYALREGVEVVAIHELRARLDGLLGRPRRRR
ncbi:MAG: ATP-binding protein [Acidobacteria bacterium]|nr:ATP-binding protein [Acidobacteriota bacterium]